MSGFVAERKKKDRSPEGTKARFVQDFLKANPDATAPAIAEAYNKTIPDNPVEPKGKSWGVYVSQQRKAAGIPPKVNAPKQRKPDGNGTMGEFERLAFARQLVAIVGDVERTEQFLSALGKATVWDAQAAVAKWKSVVDAVGEKQAGAVIDAMQGTVAK